MRNKVASILVAILFLAAAAVVVPRPVAAADPIRLMVDDRELKVDPPAQIVAGRTVVPIRFVAEALGATVEYDASGPGVWIRHPQRGTFYLFLRENGVLLPDGTRRPLDVPAQIIESRTFVPLRFVGETLGARITWDGETRTVGIHTATAPASPSPLPAAGLTEQRVPHLMYTFPDPPRADGIQLRSEAGGWHVQVVGGPGAVAPGAQVLVSSLESTESVLTRADGQGAFQARLVAAPGSFVQVKHDPLHRINRDNLAMGRPHEVNLAPGTLLRVPAPSDPAPAAAGATSTQTAATTPAATALAFHAPGHTQLDGGEGNPEAVPWLLSGQIQGLPARPGGTLRVEGELRLYLPAGAGTDLPAQVDLNLQLLRLGRADGQAVLMRELFVSTTMTPGGLPINRFGGGATPGTGYPGALASPRRVDDLTAALPVALELPVPADLEPGWYRLEARADLPAFRLPRPLFPLPLKPIFTQREAGAGLLPPLAVGSPAPLRLPWMLLADTPSQGSRGTLAQEDAGAFQLQSMIVHQTDTFVIPRDDPGTGQPIAYRLEPHLPTVNLADRGLVGTPTVAFRFPSGQLHVKVERPDGQVDDLGTAPFAQHMNTSPQTAAGHSLDDGGGNAGDIYQLTAGADRFRYRFPQDGRYVITMTGENVDVWGNRYPGGGRYEVWVARTLDLKPGLLPSTPLAVGDAVTPAVTVYPGVPAAVEWRWRFYPESRADAVAEQVVRGTANRFGYFQSVQAPVRAPGPGEYRLDILARYTDPQGRLWMGSMTWGQVVAKPGTPLILHGRRGVDTDPDIGQAWFLRQKTGIPAGQNHFNFPYHSGDVAWQTVDDAIQVRLGLQDTGGRIAGLIQQRAEGGAIENPPAGVEPDDAVRQRLAVGEGPIVSTTADLTHPAYHPDRVDQRGYWYGAAVRPDVRVRQMVSEDFASITYWRFQELYAGQLGAGVRGEATGDLKWQFGGVVWRHNPEKIYETAMYASLWAAIPDDDPLGSRTLPPFQGNGGGPNGGPVINVDGQPVDLFFVPLGVRPGTVLTLGDRFSLSGEVGPPLGAVLTAAVTAPSGRQRRIAGQANAVGYFYDPTADFAVDEVGLWTVQVQVEQQNATSAGSLTPPYPQGGILGAPQGVFHFYVVPGDQAVPLAWNLPAEGWIPGVGPLQVAGTIPAGWRDVSVHYVIQTPGWLLESGQGRIQGDQFAIPFDPPTLARRFPHLDLTARHDRRPGLSDVFTLSFLVSGRDGQNQPVALARHVTIQGPELYAPPAQTESP